MKKKFIMGKENKIYENSDSITPVTSEDLKD